MQDCNWLVNSYCRFSFVFIYFEASLLAVFVTSPIILSVYPMPLAQGVPPSNLNSRSFCQATMGTQRFFFTMHLSLNPLLLHIVSWKWLSGHTGWWLISSSPLSVLCQLYLSFYSSASKTRLSALVYQLGFSECELHVGLIASSPLRSILSMSPLMFECLSFQQEVYLSQRVKWWGIVTF